jgi:hypothetical protein
MRHRTIWSVVAALLLALLAVPALAHDGPSRLELGTTAISPGAALEVRGVNIAEEAPVSVALIGPNGAIDLGVVVGDEHGDFTHAFALPADLAAGAYTVRAFGTNRVIVTAPLTIVGAAMAEEGGQRDEDEPLLAALPRLQIPTAAPAPQVALPTATPAASVWPMIGIAVVLGALGVAVARRRGAAGVR